jgi:hypothetical protein
LSKSQPKILFTDEALGKVSEGVGLVFLQEEVGEKARKCRPSISDTAAHPIPMNFKKGKSVKKMVIFRLFKFEILTHLSC